MRQHLSITIDPSKKTLAEDIPEITFPPKVLFETSSEELVGYFVNYDNTINESNLLEEYKKDNGVKLVNSNSHFLLFYRNYETNYIEILIDQVGTFPVYIANDKKEIYISTKFHNIVKYLKSKNSFISIDPDGLMTYLLWNSHQTEKTIIHQGKRLPAGCKLQFSLDNPQIGNITSLIDLDSFLLEKIVPYTSIESFTKEWVKEITHIISDQLAKISNLPFGCDLSSGFDCTLVAYSLTKSTDKHFPCYSLFSEFTQGETDVNKMIRFAQRHGLDLKMLDVGEYMQFKHNMISHLNPEDPHQHNLTDAYFFLSKIAKTGAKIEFAGEGGDEIYGSRNIDKTAKFTTQYSYFNNVRYLKKDGVENLFAKRINEYALSRERFNSRKFYPLLIPPTSGVVYWAWGEKFWENDMWTMTPFVDTRLIRLARRIPAHIKGGMGEVKQTILREAPGIFNIEMFQEKEGLEDIYVNFIYNQRKLIDMVLENSVLAKLGIINKEHIYTLINNEKSILYSDELAISFYNIILMDWYFQANSINQINL
ncbi:MAG TPA: asparagine synthase C-terminal domain-containing protein [Patescibacteria group bacterium]